MGKRNFWNPNTEMKDFIFDISTFFWGANPESPFGIERADLFKNNRKIFDERVKYFTKKYADPSLPYKEYKNWDFSLPDELKDSNGY